MQCDICSEGLTQGQGTIMPIKEMKTIARNGFSPYKLGIAALGGTLIGVFGLNPEQMDQEWRQKVLADKTAWLLCPSCYEKTRPFAGKGAEQTKPPKRWWEFWK